MELLIIFRDGKQKVIHNVTDYGYDYKSGLYWITHADILYKGLLPSEQITYIGPKQLWEDSVEQ